MATALSSLAPGLDRLDRLAAAMGDAILAGLAAPDREIRALPAYLRKPTRDLTGRTVVLDVGGTHMRAAWVEMRAGEAALLAPVAQNELMLAAQKRELSTEEFLDAEADLIAAVCPERELSIGYCFSYPATVNRDRDAILIEWTKGIRVRGVEGLAVGALLADALRRRGRKVRAIAVLNDTVASLLAGAAMAPDYDRHIGAIVATGTNMAGFYPLAAMPKLAATDRQGWRGDEVMAINLESGDFTPRDALTSWDDALDAALPPDQRGNHRFEKAVSGAYLPRLLYDVAGRDACAASGFDPADPKTDAGTVVELRADPRLGEVARLLIDRSADLVAAGLAGLIRSYDAVGLTAPRTGILVEGNLFHLTPGYAARVVSRLGELAPKAEIGIIPKDSAAVPANILGAASAVLPLSSA
ncbi:MAG: hexokinase family protein [Stellaceae bacterium]